MGVRVYIGKGAGKSHEFFTPLRSGFDSRKKRPASAAPLAQFVQRIAQGFQHILLRVETVLPERGVGDGPLPPANLGPVGVRL